MHPKHVFPPPSLLPPHPFPYKPTPHSPYRELLLSIFLFLLLQTEMCYVEVYVNVPQEADEPSLEQFKCEPVKDDQVIKQNKKLKFH